MQTLALITSPNCFMIKKSRVSIVELARELNVSITVSRALNDNVNIGRDACRVKDCAEVWVCANHSAIKLQSGKNRAIGVIVPNIAQLLLCCC